MSGDIDRRTFLRGAAGTALALPTLEAGVDLVDEDGGRARAAGGPDGGPEEPLYYIVSFAGTATGAGGGHAEEETVDCVPDGPNATGYDYPIVEPGLSPLDREIEVHGRSGTVNVKDYVSLVSGLSMPKATDPRKAPPGSRCAYDKNLPFHSYQLAPLMTGVRSDKARADREKFTSGTSSDQRVARAWNQSRTFAGRVQADKYGSYPGRSPLYSPLSTIKRGETVDIVTPTIDPRKAFDQWVGSSGMASESSRRELLMGASEQSVLDGVLAQFKRLKNDPGLAAADRRRLERHAAKVRELEKDIGQLENKMTCDGTFPAQKWGERRGRGQKAGINQGWLYEDLRADLMADVITRAMACGQTNVATLCLSLEQSAMNVRYLVEQKGTAKGIHGTGHSPPTGSAETVQWVVNWHVRQWVKVLERLAREPAPAPYQDESMLDRSAIVLLFESGVKEENGSRTTHTTDNMVALIGGKAGTGGERLRGNVHVDAGNQSHPCSAQMTAMEAVGVTDESFGELSWETHPELFEEV